jgi:cytochrome d ubiquinol oxidase subunit II
MTLAGDAYWLPVIFIGLMGLALLLYAVLDGYDLGVGILLPGDKESQRDMMIASIGPFWDANETWLVLGVGLLLIAFPRAHSLILMHLYLPVTLMLAGLILRGVAFDFRAKVPPHNKNLWDWTFKGGSLLATLAQGYMIGMFVVGFERSWAAFGFALLSAVCVTAGYCFIGGAWLVMKADGELQQRAARWTRRACWLTALGIAAVTGVNLIGNTEIFQKWFDAPVLLIIPLLGAMAFIGVETYLRRFPIAGDAGCWIPFVGCLIIFIASFAALGYSFFPDIVPGQMNIWQAASASKSLWFILVGTLIVLPAIILYTMFSYRIFWGKTRELTYY